MKMTLIRQLVLIVLVLDFAPAASASVPQFVDAKVGQPFDLPVGAAANLGPSRIWVSFYEVVTDSRCPIHDRCFVSGTAEIRVAVGRLDKEVTTILSLAHELHSRADVFEHCLIFNELNPYPETDGGRQAREYVATLTLHSGNCGELPSNNPLEGDR